MRREAGATSLVTGPGPVVDEVAEAVGVVADVAVRRGKMSHPEQLMDVADDPQAVSLIPGPQPLCDVRMIRQRARSMT